MRKQPLLALLSTTAVLSSAGIVGHGRIAAAAPTDPRTTPHARPGASEATDPALRALLLASPGTVAVPVGTTSTSTRWSPSEVVVQGHAFLAVALARSAAVAQAARRHAAVHAAELAALRRHDAKLEARRAEVRRALARRAAADSRSEAGGVWRELRDCESGGNYSTNTGNGYYGAYQFDLSTWQSIGYSGLPSSAPPAVQDAAAQRLEAERGWSPWPVCSVMLGL